MKPVTFPNIKTIYIINLTYVGKVFEYVILGIILIDFPFLNISIQPIPKTNFDFPNL